MTAPFSAILRARARAHAGKARRELRWRTFPYRMALRPADRRANVSLGAIVRDPRHVLIAPGARIGTHAELWAFGGNPQGGQHAIILAEAADIRSFALLHAYGGSITVGRRSCVNHFCYVGGAAGVEIGDDVMLGTHTVILSSEHGIDDLDLPMTQQPMIDRPVVIEEDVYIGAHVTILPGVTVGRGAVVGAGAVVVRSVPRYAVVAGVPARVVRSRSGDPAERSERP